MTDPAVVMRPTCSRPWSLNQRLPSVPETISTRKLNCEPVENSVIALGGFGKLLTAVSSPPPLTSCSAKFTVTGVPAVSVTGTAAAVQVAAVVAVTAEQATV